MAFRDMRELLSEHRSLVQRRAWAEPGTPERDALDGELDRIQREIRSWREEDDEAEVRSDPADR